RDHAMMMVQYLLDTDVDVVIPGVAAPVPTFEGVVAPVELALALEKRVTEQNNALLITSRDVYDFAT
ncbi:MAG: ferritin, partial [Nocardioides sp.]|nr:ferritin [Nocardioides sp.]